MGDCWVILHSVGAFVSSWDIPDSDGVFRFGGLWKADCKIDNGVCFVIVLFCLDDLGMS